MYHNGMDIAEVAETIIDVVASFIVEIVKLALQIFDIKDSMQNVMIAAILGIPVAIVAAFFTIWGIIKLIAKLVHR